MILPYDEPLPNSGLPPLAIGTLVAIYEIGSLAEVIPRRHPPVLSADGVRIRFVAPAPGSFWGVGAEANFARSACCPALPRLLALLAERRSRPATTA